MEAEFTGQTCRLVFIAALDENGVIGAGHALPWHLPADIAHFRARTRGRWLLLGRHTFDEMIGWFTPAETPLVLTTHPRDLPPGAIPVATVRQALDLAQRGGQRELIHCGGGAAFACALPLADTLILTRVACQVPPAPHLVYFPVWNAEDWTLADEWSHSVDVEHAHAFRVQTWERRVPALARFA